MKLVDNRTEPEDDPEKKSRDEIALSILTTISMGNYMKHDRAFQVAAAFEYADLYIAERDRKKSQVQ
jgi:hypothetical protein